jgi:t-SNARE complex subunit (syntaxin)
MTDIDLQDLRARLERTHNDITELLNDLERYINERRKERLAKAEGRLTLVEKA